MSAMSEGDEQHGQEADQDGAVTASFSGLADMDEDLRTMSQSNAEVERWRRLSTRGLTPATGIGREEGGGLAAPIIASDAVTMEVDLHAASTAPGTITAPTEHESVSSAHPAGAHAVVPSDSTVKLGAITPAALEAVAERNARRSFAPPKDTPSAPPGSRVVLTRSSHPPAAGSGRISSRPVFVPRPSQPPPDDEAVVRGWRASDPSAAPEDATAGLAIPRPAPLPGAHRAAQAKPPVVSSAPFAGRAVGSPADPAPPTARGERPALDSSLEISGGLLALALGVALAVLFTLVYVFLL